MTEKGPVINKTKYIAQHIIRRKKDKKRNFNLGYWSKKPPSENMVLVDYEIDREGDIVLLWGSL